LHNGVTALVGATCSDLCDEIASLAGIYDALFISAGGCFGIDHTTYPTFIRSVPSDKQLGNVYVKVLKKFGQVSYLHYFSCFATWL